MTARISNLMTHGISPAPVHAVIACSVKYNNNKNKYASYPDWRISPHADRRHRQRWPVCHTGLATARPVCRTCMANDRPMHYRFFTIGLWGLPMGQSSPKGEMTWWTPRSTILHNFIALCQPTPDISATKILRTERQTKKQ